MGLRDLWNGVQRFGSAVWRRVGDTAKNIGMGAARFVAQHHAPLAMLAKSVGDASGNQYLQGAGNLAMAASGAYGALQQRQAAAQQQQNPPPDRSR